MALWVGSYRIPTCEMASYYCRFQDMSYHTDCSDKVSCELDVRG